MAQTYVYICTAIVIVTILFLIAALQNSVDDRSLLATPSITKDRAVLTAFASTKINAPVDEVWAAVTNFKASSKGSSFSEYQWKGVTADDTPRIGCTGTFKVRRLFWTSFVFPPCE